MTEIDCWCLQNDPVEHACTVVKKQSAQLSTAGVGGKTHGKDLANLP